MAAPLFQTYGMPAIASPATTPAATTSTATTEFPIAPLMTAGLGDVVIGPNGLPVWADGVIAWQQRLLMTILQTRGQSPLVAPGAGTQFDLDAMHPSQAQRESALSADVRTAAQHDPFTAGVDGFRYIWSGDGLWITFTATSIQGHAAELALPLISVGAH